VVAIQIRDTVSSRPGGRTFYPTPEYLELEAQNHVFDEVIGGTGDDVLYNNGEGMEQFMGGYVTPNTLLRRTRADSWACRRCWDAPSSRMTQSRRHRRFS
jgi:hypothetical protein